jgi:protein phosphatase
MAIDLSAALEIATRSDPGRVRPHNEDSVFADAALGFAVLADGMGGYNAGEVASGMATAPLGAELAKAFAERGPDEIEADGQCWASVALAGAIVRTNVAIHLAAESQPQYSGMGTTLVAALFHDNRLTVAHIGDSRLYRLRGDKLAQLTRDHSLLQEQVDDGIITAEQARLAKNRNLVTRALGVDPTVEIEVNDHEARAGDVFLLCSDGLTDMIDDGAIASTLSSFSAQPGQCAIRLVDMANEHGGRDNVSVIVVRVKQTFPARLGWWARLRSWFGSRGR